METDRYGHALATASARAAAAYREGVDLLLSAYPGAEDRFREALNRDPEFALAHAGLARGFQIYQRAADARASIAEARRLAAGASRREQAHVHVLALAIGGESAKALEALLDHVEAHPRDALVLSLALGAFGLYAFSGRADHDAARLDLCRRLAPHYGEDWWFLTHLGWSHTEAGHLEAGGRITERALALRRANAHAAHAYAHYFAEARQAARGVAFLDSWLPAYDARGALYAHLHWHKALWMLDQGDLDAALAIYRDVLRPAVNLAPPINVVSDAASLQWRLLLLEKPEDRLEVLDYARARYPGPVPPFIEWHLAMVGDRGTRPASPAVLHDVCAALTAYAQGRYAEAVNLLEAQAKDFARLGGSGAQRRVLLETLEAARRRAAR